MLASSSAQQFSLENATTSEQQCIQSSCSAGRDQRLILPRYNPERFHEIASACANQCNVCRPSGWIFIAVCEEFFPKIQLYSVVGMDGSLQLPSDTTTESLLELGSVSDVSLNDWNEELSAGSNKTRAEKHGGSLSTNAEPIPGTKDPMKSLKCDAKLRKKGEKAPSTGSDASKKAVVSETVTKPSHSSKGKSAPKEQRTGSGLQQSATPGQSSTTDVAVLLKEAFLVLLWK